MSGYVKDTLLATNFALLRFNPDGIIDTTFGNNGLVSTDLGSNEYSLSLILCSDGKILIAGLSNQDDIMLQYLPDGAIDTTFGYNGIVRLNGGSYQTGLENLHLLPNGKILATGTYGDEFGRTFALYRFMANGALDLSFGTNGMVRTDLTEATAAFTDARSYYSLIQADGKIVLAGTKYINEEDQLPMLIRYHSDGRIDQNFGDNGRFILLGVRKGAAYYVQQQPEGLLFAFETQTREGGSL